VLFLSAAIPSIALGIMFLFFSPAFQGYSLASILSRIPQPGTLDGTVIADGSFEKDSLQVDSRFPSDFWGSTGNRFGGGQVLVTSEEKHSGQYSLRISSSYSQAAYVYQYFQLATSDYTFSFWYKGSAGDGTAEVLTGWGPPPWFLGGSNNGQLGSEVDLDSGPKFPLDGEWHHAVVVNNASSQARYLDGKLVDCQKGNSIVPAEIIIGDTSTRAGNSEFYIDDVSLVSRHTAQFLGCEYVSPPTPLQHKVIWYSTILHSSTGPDVITDHLQKNSSLSIEVRYLPITNLDGSDLVSFGFPDWS